MTAIVNFSTNTYGELQVDSPNRTLHQDIQGPIFDVATEKKPSNEDQGRISPELYAAFRDIIADDFYPYVTK
jgi:Uma2 family endonuclease